MTDTRKEAEEIAEIEKEQRKYSKGAAYRRHTVYLLNALQDKDKRISELGELLSQETKNGFDYRIKVQNRDKKIDLQHETIIEKFRKETKNLEQIKDLEAKFKEAKRLLRHWTDQFPRGE